MSTLDDDTATPSPEAPPLEAVPPTMLLADPAELEHYGGGAPSPDQQKADSEAKEKLAEAVQELTAKALVPPAVSSAPAWGHIPTVGPDGKAFRFPAGRQVMFILLRAEWTDTPTLGDRHLITWPITPGDYKFAISRAMGDPNRIQDELTKQAIRAIDGNCSDWAGGGKYSPNVLWDQIGQKCRYLLTRIYIQQNTLSQKETRDFFENCISVVSTG